MKTDDKILLGGILIVVVVMICIVYSIESTTAHKLYEGKIDEVVTFYKDDNTIDYMILYLDDGTTIKVYEPDTQNTLDLTVNSKQIIKLLKRPWQEHWTITKIIKIPEE